MDSLTSTVPPGFSLPSPAYLVGAILFGLIGFAAYRYGKSMSFPRTRWIGLTLMLYPYAVSETWLMYLVGAGLCGALYWFHQQ